MRIQLELSENSVAQIKALMKEANIRTYSDVFSSALAILNWAVKEKRKGLRIVSANEKTNEVTELAMPVLDAVGPLPSPSPTREEEDMASTKKGR
jgi:hypothetical protein